jgi:hypothetical protein
VARWTCPRCDREFARQHQSHVCVPGCTVDECFAGRPASQRAIYDELMAHMHTLGPVHVDAVKVGIFLKHDRKFAEIRPAARSLSLSLTLPRRVDDPRVARAIPVSADRTVHFVKLREVPEVDALVRDWLTEAYHAAGDFDV